MNQFWINNDTAVCKSWQQLTEYRPVNPSHNYAAWCYITHWNPIKDPWGASDPSLTTAAPVALFSSWSAKLMHITNITTLWVIIATALYSCPVFLRGGKLRITTKNNFEREISRSATLRMGLQKEQNPRRVRWFISIEGAQRSRRRESGRSRGTAWGSEGGEDDMLFLRA